MGEDRGFGIEVEDTYAEAVNKSDFELDWFVEAETNNFSMNGEPITKSGSSRMNKRARAGVLKPTGQTEMDADLQRIGHLLYGYLGNYEYTAASGTGTINTHEFWGEENKQLPSFRGISMKDFVKKYLFGLLVESLKLEVSDDSLKVSNDWIYKTEKVDIIGENSAEWERPEDLDDDLFVMFYDIIVKLNNKNLLGDNGIVNSFSFEGKNNHDQDGSVGLGAREPQARATSDKRDNKISLALMLTKSIIHDILAMEYGAVNAMEMDSCKILNVPLEVNVSLCEYSSQSLKILFPKCTVAVAYDGNGAEAIKANLTLVTLGSDTVTLEDETTEVVTDMYVCLKNKQAKIEAKE